jgi:hypothetical protein
MFAWRPHSWDSLERLHGHPKDPGSLYKKFEYNFGFVLAA